LVDEAFGYLKRVIVTPAVYPRLAGSLRIDNQSTGQKSPCGISPPVLSQSCVSIKQSDSPAQQQFQVSHQVAPGADPAGGRWPPTRPPATERTGRVRAEPACGPHRCPETPARVGAASTTAEPTTGPRDLASGANVSSKGTHPVCRLPLAALRPWTSGVWPRRPAAVIQYEAQGPETRSARGPFIGASDVPPWARWRIPSGARGPVPSFRAETTSAETALPCWAEGLRHRLSCRSIAHMSLHQEETRTPRGEHCPCVPRARVVRCYHPDLPQSQHSRRLHLLACLPFLRMGPPTHADRIGTGASSAVPSPAAHPVAGAWAGCNTSSSLVASRSIRWGRIEPPVCSFGCLVPLPLGSRSADPHSTAVWCGNLLHSSPQSRTAWAVPALHPMEYSLLQPRSAPGATPVGGNPNGGGGPLCPLTLPTLCQTRPCHRGGGGLWDEFSFTDLGTIRFRSCPLRQVSCYTFLSGFQPSWPPSCYP
jgi:hypothetical protein